MQCSCILLPNGISRDEATIRADLPDEPSTTAQFLKTMAWSLSVPMSVPAYPLLSKPAVEYVVAAEGFELEEEDANLEGADGDSAVLSDGLPEDSNPSFTSSRCTP